MSDDAILTRDEVQHWYGEHQAATRQAVRRQAFLKIGDSHIALLAEHERALDALKRVEDIYAFWLESGDSTTAMDELVYTNEIVVEALGDRSDYATPVVLPQDAT